MSAQLADPSQAAPPTGRLPPVVVAPPPPPAVRPRRAASPEARHEALAPDGADRGIGLLLRFLGAMLVMVADVVVLGALGRSWVLIPAFSVLLLTTGVVLTGIMRLLKDGAEDHR